MAVVAMAAGAMLIIQQHKRDEKTGSHGTFQIGLLTFGLFALLILLPSGLQAAAERRLQIGFVSIVPGIAPLWVAAVATIQVEDVIDTRILRKLDESGFIDALDNASGAR
jgi:hypothetical protein